MRPSVWGAVFLIGSLYGVMASSGSLRPAEEPFPKFVEQTVDANLGIGYAVALADVNGDEKTDIVAINPTQLIWYDNPDWKKHVVLDGLTQKDNVCLAPLDIDRDGR